MTAISEEAYDELQNVTLQPPSLLLFGPTYKALKVLGQFNGTFLRGQKVSSQTYDELQNVTLQPPSLLLFGPTHKALKVL